MIHAASSERYQIHDLVLDVNNAAVMRQSEKLAITGLTFDLFFCLVRHAPNLVPKEILLEDIWPGAHVGEETLKQRVRLLRKSLRDDPKKPRYVETVRGRGYRLIPEVTLLKGPYQEPVKVKKPVPLQILPLACLVILVAGIVWFSSGDGMPAQAKEANHHVNETLTARELFDRGRIYYQRYLPNDNETSIRLLKQAIKSDPSFAPAHALLSKAYSQQPKLGNGFWGKEARAAAQRAIDLAGNSPEGYIALGLAEDVAGFPTRGLESYRKALHLEPGNAVAIANTACNYLIKGQLLEALHWNIRSMEKDPNLYFAKLQMGETLRLLGMEEKARAWLEKASVLQPDNALAQNALMKLLLLEGRYDEANAQIEQSSRYPWGQRMRINSIGDVAFFCGNLILARESFAKTWTDGDSYGGFRLGQVLFLLGDPRATELLDRMEKALDESIAGGLESPFMRLQKAAIAATFNHDEEALRWLDEALHAGWTDLKWLNQDPGLEVLRAIPGFESRQMALETKRFSLQQRVLNSPLIP